MTASGARAKHTTRTGNRYVIEHHWGNHWAWFHEDFDPTPWETGGPSHDRRRGSGTSLSDCVFEIELFEFEQGLCDYDPTEFRAEFSEFISSLRA